MKHQVINDTLSNRGFEIPPNHPNYRIGSSRVLDKDILVLTYWPHAHLRATAARYVAHYPDGTEELLLDVPHYDQSWQVTYKYKEPKLLPKGTRIDVDFWYDNSPERASRPRLRPEPLRGPRAADRRRDVARIHRLRRARRVRGDAGRDQQQLTNPPRPVRHASTGRGRFGPALLLSPCNIECPKSVTDPLPPTS